MKDGGAPIEGYLIEKREKNEHLWVKAAEVSSDLNNVLVEELTEGKEYEFRAFAINKAGTSLPSDPSRIQLVQPKFSTYLV